MSFWGGTFILYVCIHMQKRKLATEYQVPKFRVFPWDARAALLSLSLHYACMHTRSTARTRCTSSQKTTEGEGRSFFFVRFPLSIQAVFSSFPSTKRDSWDLPKSQLFWNNYKIRLSLLFDSLFHSFTKLKTNCVDSYKDIFFPFFPLFFLF